MDGISIWIAALNSFRRCVSCSCFGSNSRHPPYGSRGSLRTSVARPKILHNIRIHLNVQVPLPDNSLRPVL
jgi:hypothetical protein